MYAYVSCTTTNSVAENVTSSQSANEAKPVVKVDATSTTIGSESPDHLKPDSEIKIELVRADEPEQVVEKNEAAGISKNVKHVETIATGGDTDYSTLKSIHTTGAGSAIVPAESGTLRNTDGEHYSPSYYEEYTSPIISPSGPAASFFKAVDPTLAGQLTAGEINDFQKWNMWEDIAAHELEVYQKLWHIAPGKRYTVLVQNATGNAVIDALAELIDKNGNTIWKSRTDNTGKAELWGSMDTQIQQQTPDHILISYNKESKKIKRIVPTEMGVNQVKLSAECDVAENIELLFTVDATGSMGDEIEYLQAELVDVIEKIKSTHPELKVKLGSVFYRDHGDTYVTKTSELSEDISLTSQFIAEQYADGGGDGPEAVDDALEAGINEIAWSPKARTRIMFMILDAPPHHESTNISRILKNIALASQKGIRIIPLVASGGGFEMDKSLEYLMRTWALATNGTYAFLTDHSGIGDAHTAPSTDKYEVEKLNDLLVRIIDQFIYAPSCNYQEWIDLTEQQDTVSYIDSDIASIPAYADTTASGADSLVTDIPFDIFEIRCYPNPATDYVMIQTSEHVDDMFLADNAGKLIQRITPADLLTRIDLTGYPSGMYHVKAWTKNRWASVRIVVAHI